MPPFILSRSTHTLVVSLLDLIEWYTRKRSGQVRTFVRMTGDFNCSICNKKRPTPVYSAFTVDLSSNFAEFAFLYLALKSMACDLRSCDSLLMVQGPGQTSFTASSQSLVSLLSSGIDDTFGFGYRYCIQSMAQHGFLHRRSL
jgi:hypothetical protein